MSSVPAQVKTTTLDQIETAYDLFTNQPDGVLKVPITACRRGVLKGVPISHIEVNASHPPATGDGVETSTRHRRQTIPYVWWT